MSNKRTIISVILGIWIRLLSIVIPFTFPVQIPTFLHRLRGVKVGNGSKISRNALLDDTYPHLIEIGKNVWIAAGVMILCHKRDLTHYGIGKQVMDCPFIVGKVILKDGAQIGSGAIIMNSVTIGEGAIVGAGSVVTKNIPSYSVAVGIPAKVIKKFH